ncbi:MAG: hypothetical protein ABIJ47_03990 [Candidatus Bathyarchaeota archaeon]
MKQSQNHAAKHLAVAAIAIMLLAPMMLTGVVVPVEGAAARVYFAAASPDKSGYAVDEAVKINVKFKWEGLSANTTVAIELWNSTEVMEDLGDYKAPGAILASGTATVQYTPTVDLTEETGTKTYNLKMLSGGIVVDSANVVIVVAAGQITMSVTWQDQNNDRVVDVNELVTFTAYVNWAFVETTESHSLYVNYGEGEKLLSSISVTAGSGSQTVTDSHGFSSAGAKAVAFTLKDATGTTVKTSTAAISVGAAAPTPQAPAQTSIVGIITANWQILAILVAAGAIGYVYLGDGNKRKRGK